ncbi:MG2 domain-containing protein [Winogradskyella maritima]|uniref:MG2 domain-containing protein n=1 Tax=Winogradskyella maritima TaxID=1517766 RepID=A0ABV8AII7_9FLAO|nr:MG2 domain-containing protein [Winogradskyella maritima]
MTFKNCVCLILAVAFAFSCKKKTIETDNIYNFRDYISYTTSGVVSVASPIRISFSETVEGWKPETEIDTKLIEIKPKADGRLVVKSSNILEFIPDEPLQPDTEYSITIKLEDIYSNIPKEYKDYTFQFKTITPSFNISTNALQSYSKSWQYMNGVLRSADVISLSDAKQLVEAEQNDKDLNIVWNTKSESAKYFEFKIDSIQRFEGESKLLVSWNGKAIKAENKGENDISIPGKDNFSIVQVEVNQAPEQHLSINFSDPLKKQQNFDGLVNIQNVKNLKYVVDGNILKVYPTEKIVGDVLVEIFNGITSTDNYNLKNPYSETISFEALKPEVRLISSGTILPNSKNLTFNFEAVNLQKVDVRIIKIFEDNVLQFLQSNNLDSNYEYAIKNVGRRVAKQTITLMESPSENNGDWRAYSIDLSQYMQAEAGSIYRVELSFKQEYSLFACNGNSDDNSDDDFVEEDFNYYTALQDDIDEELREEAYWDNINYSYRNRNYDYRERNNPCSSSYFKAKNPVAQNLIASNLGVIAKQGAERDYFFAVTDILTTQPKSGVNISLYNYQQQKLKSTSTNSTGIAKIGTEQRASFAIVSQGKNVTYVKLMDGNALSLSKFNVSGQKLQRGLKGYIYGERGVWRPSDSLFLTFVLNDNANQLPSRHPVKLEITDPVGKLVHRKVSIDNVNHFYDFNVPTSSNYKTGNYNATISVGGAKFTKTLKIETIKPNRLKLKIDVEDDLLSIKKPLDATLNVAWLHAAPAKNVRAEIKTKFTASNASIKNYESYTFTDPTKNFASEESVLFDGKVDAEGNVKIEKDLSINGNAPGMLSAQFLVRAFETGGDFSMDAFTMPFAPYETFVGLKSPEESKYGAYFTDENHTFDIVTTTPKGQPVSQNIVEVKVYKIEWRWWWNSSYDDLASYVSSDYHRPMQAFNVNTNAQGRATFKLNIPEEERGRYLIRVTNPESGHSTGRTAYFYKNWWGSATNGDKESAKMLVFSSDKDNYNVGDTAKITFPSGEAGRALISIENGSEVLSHQWVKTEKGESTIEIPVTEAMAPNVFVNISLLQPHAVTANDLPIRLYGVIPMGVENPKSILQPEISMPKSIKPKEDYSIKVSEANGQPMTYTLAVVEEGLLDLTRFKTPNPWDSFYAKEALGVKTWDVFDDVIGAYSGSIDQVFAIGGDGSATAGKNKKANRFKPVVTYLGPFVLKAGQTQTHNLKMPNYIGSVRAMVIAGNNSVEAYGNAEKAVPVKQPLMVLATVPRTLSPGEKLTLPVTVFAMENKVKTVDIDLKSSEGIKVLGDKNQRLSFKKPDEQMAYFELDVSQAKGIQTIEVVASGNGERSSYKVEIDVENPNPITSKLIDKSLQAKSESTLSFNTFGEMGTNTAQIEFSTLPPMDFSKRLAYLIRYPHGCVEQTTSGAFPQLFLSDIFDLTGQRKAEIQKNIKSAIRRLGNFQRPDGGLSYWIGESSADDWGTTYAGHFMLEAEQKGYVLPLSFKTNWLRYQKLKARQWRPRYNSYNNDLAQAYRLYTLALVGEADLASMNRLRNFDQLSNNAKWRLALAYALAGQKEASDAISKTANLDFNPNRYGYYNYGSRDRNRAMALETMVLTNNPKARELAVSLGKSLSSDTWMSTQTTAYSLLAMAKLLKSNGGKAIDVTYELDGETFTINSKNAMAQRELSIGRGQNQIKITNKGENQVYARVLYSGKLPLGQETSVQRGLLVNTAFKDLSGKPISISNLKQGQDFVASVTVSNLKNDDVDNVALSQIFPSGWTIVNTRFNDFGDTVVSSARHTDIRDDRVNFYFDLKAKSNNQSSKTFTVLLNASYLGRYYLPGIQAEAMYDNDFLVRTKGQWITVEK